MPTALNGQAVELAASGDSAPQRSPPEMNGEVVEERAGDSSVDPSVVSRPGIRRAAWQYRAGRQNIFFDELAFLESLPEVDGDYLSTLQTELSMFAELEALPPSTRFLEGRPETVLERMAMIDLLAELAEHDQEAADAMVMLLLQPIDGSLPDVAKKALVGERQDLLVALVQTDQEAAFDAFSRITQEGLRHLLKPALLKGLYEEGYSDEAADAMTAHL